MKVLISCYACSPYRGSEPGMGWNFVNCLCRVHELHIITESKFRYDLEKYFYEHPDERQFFHFYFVHKKRHKLLRKIWPPSYYWFYRIWQKDVYNLAKELDKKEHFDIVHQLNMIGFREPGYLWRMGKPLIWGPIGGFNVTPWRLLFSMGFKGGAYYAVRNVMNIWQMRFSHRVKKMAKKANVIISATKDSYNVVTELWHKRSVLIPEVGLTEFLPKDSLLNNDSRLHLCWSGLHIPRKSLNLLLEAIAKGNLKERVQLHVIGQGERTKAWMKLAEKLNINNVVWHGWIARSEALQIMGQSDIFVITSMADATSTVLLEALSLGLPVIAPNLFGFANVLTEECAIKIDIRTKSQVVDDLAKAINLLYENKDLRLTLSRGAVARAKDFSWEKKAEEINSIYTSVKNALL